MFTLDDLNFSKKQYNIAVVKLERKDEKPPFRSIHVVMCRSIEEHTFRFMHILCSRPLTN